MKREEDWLREACGELAEEEIDRLEHTLSPDERRQAEILYRRHKKTALSLIRRKSARSAAAPYLRAAAILALLVGAVYFSLRQSGPEKTPQVQPPAFTLAPYYPDAPSPVPVSPAPTAAPAPTPAPTPTPVPPTPTPSPAPTASPTPEAIVTPVLPTGWTGNYFPSIIPDAANVSQADVYAEEGGETAVLTAPQDGWTLRFTEYASSVAVPVPEDAQVSYVRITDGVIALRAETAMGVTLTWDQEGQTLSLFLSGDAPPETGVPLEIARSVKKITEQ